MAFGPPSPGDPKAPQAAASRRTLQNRLADWHADRPGSSREDRSSLKAILTLSQSVSMRVKTDAGAMRDSSRSMLKTMIFLGRFSTVFSEGGGRGPISRIRKRVRSGCDKDYTFSPIFRQTAPPLPGCQGASEFCVKIRAERLRIAASDSAARSRRLRI
jgi:hypothetical protein